MEQNQHFSSEGMILTFISTKHISANSSLLNRLRNDLQEIKVLEYGRPIRYYHAFRVYTIYIGIAILERLLMESPIDQKHVIADLLKAYHSMTME